jgi:hypothetical protein
MRHVIELFATTSASLVPKSDEGTTIAVFRSGQDLAALLPALRRLIDSTPG